MDIILLDIMDSMDFSINLLLLTIISIRDRSMIILSGRVGAQLRLGMLRVPCVPREEGTRTNAWMMLTLKR